MNLLIQFLIFTALGGVLGWTLRGMWDERTAPQPLRGVPRSKMEGNSFFIGFARDPQGVMKVSALIAEGVQPWDQDPRFERILGAISMNPDEFSPWLDGINRWWEEREMPFVEEES